MPQRALSHPGGPPTETETDGWVYGAITDYDCPEPQTEGDGFVVAPDGSRAGIVWAVDSEDLYEILPSDTNRWGVHGVRVPRPASSVDDLIFNLRAILPALQRRFQELRENRG